MQLLLTARLSVAILLALACLCLAQNDNHPDPKSKPLAKWIDILKDDKDAKLCSEAAGALGPKGPYAKAAVAAIIEALKDKKPLQADTAAFILAEYGPPVVPVLLQSLKSPVVSVRAAGARALGLVKPKPREAARPLADALKDPSPEVRIAAAYSLCDLRQRASEAVSALVAALQDNNDTVRQAAAEALSQMPRKSKPAIPALTALLKDKNERTREAAADALGKIGPDAKTAVPVLIECVQHKKRSSGVFARALASIGPAAKDAVPVLVEAIQGDDDELLAAAAFALGEIGPEAKAAVPTLLKALENEDYSNRGGIIYALGKIGPEARKAVPIMIDALKMPKSRGFPYVAAEALGGIGPDAKPAVPALMARARDQLAYSPIREAAAKAVMKIDPKLAAKEGMETAYLTIRLGKIPAVKPAPRVALTEEKKKGIKALITKLAEVQNPDFGLSARLTGHAFAPIPDQSQMSVGLLPTQGVKPSEAFRELVELGPDALPFLLDALADKTPTKLKVDCSFAMIKVFGGDVHGGNPLNRSEQRVLSKPAASDEDDDDDVPDSYTVKVGDVCFVAIGQIVGREYLALRYVPTGCVVVNSPTEKKELRDRVRMLWSSKDPAKTLLDSLLVDYATEGIFNGKSLDGWHEGSEFQIQAALRLLYYFPKEFEPLITARLKSLGVRPAKNEDGWMLNDVQNGVRTIDFIQAVSWCKLPSIQAALADIAKRTDNPHIKEASTARKANPGERP